MFSENKVDVVEFVLVLKQSNVIKIIAVKF